MAKIAKPKKEADVIGVAGITDVPALVIAPEKAPALTGNFNQVEAFLALCEEQVTSIKFTEDNMDQVALVKRSMAALRNRLDGAVKEAKKRLFNDPKTLFDTRMKPFFTRIEAIEGKADVVLGKLEGRRRDELGKVFDIYKSGFQEKYKLEPEFLERVEYKEKYYNKTAVEKDSKNDLEQQFITLKKEQDARAASFRLIKTMCKDDPRLNVQHWIDQLAFKDIAIVTEEITAEKERLAGFDRGGPVKDSAGEEYSDAEEETTGGTEDAAKAILGIPHTIDFSSDFLDRTKKRTLDMEYPCDLGDAIKEMFTMLRPYGIKVRTRKEPEAVF
jgi:hypothetical protein